MTDPLLLTVTEAAARLNLGRSTVYGLAASGELPSVRPVLRPVPTEAEQRAFERRLAQWLADVNEAWLRRQEAGR